MTKQEAFNEINRTQDEYVLQLKNILESNDDSFLNCIKEVNFTSPTGTGKTKMIAKLCNLMPDYFFLITTLSRGQLNIQVETHLKEDIKQDNYVVYGVCDYTANTKLTSEEILKLLPTDKKVIWIRDEGHIHTNKWMNLLEGNVNKIVNVSATNTHAWGVNCNFIHTMMLRTVEQEIGDVAMALDKLLEVKKVHEKYISSQKYNPCAILRIIDDKDKDKIIEEINKRNLKYVDLNYENYDMSELCKDSCPVDVIINKLKLTEGIDIRRAHVIYFSSCPSKCSTIVQAVGRCRRNALLYRDDIDILDGKYSDLLKSTRICYAFYKSDSTNATTNEDGEFIQDFCPTISCEMLKVGSKVHVTNGELDNGLSIIELQGCDGDYEIVKDEETGFNVVKGDIDFYKNETETRQCNYGNEPRLVTVSNTSLVVHLKIRSRDTDAEYNVSTRKLNFQKHSLNSSMTVRIVGGSLNKYKSKRKNRWHIKFPSSFTQDRVEGNKFIRSDSDKYCLINGDTIEVVLHITSGAEVDANEFTEFFPTYDRTVNDRELAIVGVDYMRRVKNKLFYSYEEDTPLTSKIRIGDSKLSKFLSNKYNNVIMSTKSQLYSGKNNFNFSARCNSCLGYCVEYYSKYLIYGEKYLDTIVDAYCEIENLIRHRRFILDESTDWNGDIKNRIAVRACILKYREMMSKAYPNVTVTSISMEALTKKEYDFFVDEVIRLGTRTANFVKSKIPNQTWEKYDPILNVKHITGVADYLSEDTIIDVKVTNAITSTYVLQLCGYHYLSTKRSDLHIKHGYIYDAVADKCVEMNF